MPTSQEKAMNTDTDKIIDKFAFGRFYFFFRRVHPDS